MLFLIEVLNFNCFLFVLFWANVVEHRVSLHGSAEAYRNPGRAQSPDVLREADGR